MTVPTKTGRGEQEASARLTVVYPEPSVVTAALGITPDTSWRAGDARRPGFRPAKCGTWRLIEDEVAIPDNSWYGEYVERCLRRLLLRIEPTEFRRRLATIDPNLRPAIVLTGSVYGLPNVYIPPELAEKIGELGAAIEEDFYALPSKEESPGGA